MLFVNPSKIIWLENVNKKSKQMKTLKFYKTNKNSKLNTMKTAGLFVTEFIFVHVLF